MEGLNKRASRFVRPQNPKPFRITNRDKLIVKAINDYRVISQEQIQRLFFPSKNTAQVRLQLLWSHAYIQRQFQLISPDSIATRTLYRIDRKGVDLLKIEYGYTAHESRYSATKQFSEMFLHHTLGLSEIRLQFEKSCQANGMNFLTWDDEKAMKHSYDKVLVGNHYVPVLPDAYAVVEKGDGKYRFFIEYDRTSEQMKYVKRKLLALKQYFLHGGCKARYGTDKIRVLFIVEGDDHQGRVKKIVASDWGADLGKWFWYAPLAIFQDQDILTEQVWNTDQHDTMRALLNIEAI